MKDYFAEINQNFENTLVEGNYPQPNALQQAILKRIKQGGDLLVVAPQGSGKTYGAILGSLMKCPQAQEGSPRVIILTNDNDEVVENTKKLTHITRRKDLMIEAANDKGKIVRQRVFIFQGADMVLGSAKRIYDLYIQNGVNLNMLNLLILDNPDKFLTDKAMGEMIRIAEGLPKCQRIFLVEEITPRVERLMNHFLVNPLVIDEKTKD